MMKMDDTRGIGTTHPPTHFSGLGSRKGYPRKRGTGPLRYVYTNPPTPTKSYSGPRASKEDKRNTPTHLRGPEKLLRTYLSIWRKRDDENR